MVFKTTISEAIEIDKIKQALDQLINAQGKWNFDLEDCDNILRVESNNVSPKNISNILLTNGFDCVELE